MPTADHDVSECWSTLEVCGVIRAAAPLVAGNQRVRAERSGSDHSTCRITANRRERVRGLTVLDPAQQRVQEPARLWSGSAPAMTYAGSHVQTQELLGLLAAAHAF